MKYLIQNKNWNIAEDYNLDKILYLLIDRPNLINGYNSFIWKNTSGYYHRDYDLPSFISMIHYSIIWRRNGVLYKPVLRNNK